MAERSGNSGAMSVDSLALRIPGRDAAFGRRVAERAMALVAERLPDGARGDYGALKLRVRVRGVSAGEMSESIAGALIGALSRRSA
jgi:hypothetical protein